jgi:hypothetical protein
MSGSQTNLFSPLFKWAHRQDENFTTDAFVAVIRELLGRDQALAKRFLEWLCFGSEQTFSSVPHISTQMKTPDGTPDIHVAASGVFALIEVKKGSDLHEGQLFRYHGLLGRRQEPMKRLVLLTAFNATVAPDEQPDRWLRWSDVAAWFERNPPTDPVAQWLVRQFLSFLREQIMTIEKVEWQYIEGTKALFNLTQMVEKALELAGIPQHQRSAAWNSRGVYTEDKQFWVGIYTNRPEVVRFQFDTAKPDVEKLREHGWEYLDNAYATTIDLSAEAVHFFARTKDSQLDLLTQFVRNAFSTGNACTLPA